MPRRAIGPFSELQGLPNINVLSADSLDILERMDAVNAALAANDCNCNGHSLGTQRDPYWGGDISELVFRCAPHEIYGVDEEGNPTIEIVAIKLESLTVEVDSNNEICVWIYEESPITPISARR